MKKIGLFILGFLAIIQLQAQNGVAISTSSSATPDASAILDVQSTTQGILIPRVDIANLSNAAPVASPVVSLMVYNSNTTTGPGFFYWDGSAWVSATGAKSINDLTDGVATNNNVFLGFNAGGISAGQFNVATGLDAMKLNNAGHSNSAYGYLSLSTNIVGNSNSAFGTLSLENATGSKNTALGNAAGTTITSGSENILLGSNVDVSAATANNELNIGKLIYGTNVYNTTGKIGIGNGNNAPNSTLDIKGSITKSIVTKSSAYTVSDNDYTIIVTAGTTITLPNANTCKGREYVIRTTGSIVTLNGGGSNIVNHTQAGSASMQLGIYVAHAGHGHSAIDIHVKMISVTVQSDGTRWYVIADHSYTDSN